MPPGIPPPPGKPRNVNAPLIAPLMPDRNALNPNIEPNPALTDPRMRAAIPTYDAPATAPPAPAAAAAAAAAAPSFVISRRCPHVPIVNAVPGIF